jgi:hypothetical protein
MHRPTLRTVILGIAVAVMAAASSASATDVTVSRVADGTAAAILAGAKPHASVKLRKCVSAAYYDGRLISFRARMARFSDTNAPQTLRMRFDVYQRLDEDRQYRRLTADGLGVWYSSSDAATIYQRDLTLSDVETAASYRVRVSYRWVTSGGTVEFRRRLNSVDCRQKRRLPQLRIAGARVVPVAGSTQMTHTLTIANSGGSEAVNVPVALFVDGASPIVATIESIGPRQTVDVELLAPGCRVGAWATIDPQVTLPRLTGDLRRSEQLTSC